MFKLGAGLAVAVIAVVLLLVAGGDEPALSPQDQATPIPTETATPTPTPFAAGAGTVSVRVVDGTLDVDPVEVERDGGAVALQIENTTTDTVEVILARGRPGDGYDEIQTALVTGDVVQAGQQQLDRVALERGSYTLILRPVEESPAVTDSVRLRVR